MLKKNKAKINPCDKKDETENCLRNNPQHAIFSVVNFQKICNLFRFASLCMKSNEYVAFLRGINVGGVVVKMVDVKELFTSLGFEDIRTLLASGNIVFKTTQTSKEKLITLIEQALEKRYGRHIDVLVRSLLD